MTHLDDAQPQTSLSNRGSCGGVVAGLDAHKNRGLPTDTDQLNRPQVDLAGKDGQTLIPNIGSGRRQHLRASPSFRGHFGCSDGAGREWQLSDQIIEQ